MLNPIFVWIVTVLGETMRRSRLPDDVWRFAREQTASKKLYVACAAPAPFERTPLNLTCKI